jgi:hypothetical protein
VSGLTSIRIAALLAIGYGLWVLVGGPVQFGAGGESVTMRLSIASPLTWLVGLLAVVIGCSLWARFAWAWWLGLAAALFQGWRLLAPVFAGGRFPRMPGTTTLLVLALLLVFIVLLFMPKARASCSR